MEAKALGIPMGAPWFKFKDLAKQHGIVALSSNYALYADMSNRVMGILRQFSPDQEVYSIDECFLDMTGFKRMDLIAYGQEIRRRILQWTGLPVCVGIGATKTLAKMANHCAKKRPEFSGVCNLNLMKEQDLNNLLGQIEVGEVWGVGRRIAPRLNALGIQSVLDLQQADHEWLRQQFSVVMEKTIRELNGTVCIELEDAPPPKKQILSSRSFGEPVTDLGGLQQSISLYMTRASEKLRRQASFAGSVHVFIRTSPFRPDDPQYSNAITVPLPTPTDDTMRLVTVALWALRRIYRPGYRYAKAGVMLSEIVPREGCQQDLFVSNSAGLKGDHLMSAIDAINNKMGKDSLKLGSEGYRKPWAMKQGNKSPSYTTKWADVPTIFS